MPGAPPEFSECSGARKRQQELLVLNQRKKHQSKMTTAWYVCVLTSINISLYWIMYSMRETIPLSHM